MLKKQCKYISIILAFFLVMQLGLITSFAESASKAPSGVEVKSGKSSITLSWAAADGAVEYRIYRSKLGYNDFQQVGNTGELYFEDTTVEKDTTYLYKVSALNESGEEDYSVTVLGMAEWSFPELVSKIDITAAGTGNRMRIGDLDGDGRYDILMVQPAYEANDAYNPRYVGCLTAYDIEGNQLWQVGRVDSRVTTSGADEPVQIYDIDNDGYNEVLTVMNLGQGKRFYVFDGRTGEIEGSYQLPNNRAHDAIFIANFRGRDIPQDILLKDRYTNIWAMYIDEETGEFKQLWYCNVDTGHSLLPFDFDGDGKDELVNSYTLIGHDGSIIWRKNHPDHCDTHWVADINNDGKYEIILGGSDTFCYTFEGELLWQNTDTVEPQQILVGEYRIDYPGMEIAGLDRINRGNPGKDGMFLFSSDGITIYHEDRAMGDWGTIVRPLDNWTGSYVPLITAYRRGKDADNPQGVVPKLYDGFFNPIVVFEGHTDAREQVMVADMCGDSRDELIIYNLTGELAVFIYSNGSSTLREHITGKTRMSDFRNYNFSRYDSRRYELSIENMVPSGIEAVAEGENTYIKWIPILGADRYNIYRSEEEHGEYVKIGSSEIPEYTDVNTLGNLYYYKVTAVNNDGESKLPIVAGKTVVSVNKSALVELIQQVQLLDKNLYTPESWSVFEEALASAVSVRDNEDATQEEVDNAVNELQNAINNLQLVAVNPVAVLSGSSSVQVDSRFVVNIELKNLKERIYAEDIQVDYDSNLYTFIGIEGANENIMVISPDDETVTEAGKIRIIAANNGGFEEDGVILKLKFQATGKAGESGQISVTRAQLGTADGAVTDAEGSVLKVTIAGIPVTGVRLNRTELKFSKAGASERLTAIITPENATNKEVTWRTSNPSVATVDQNGLVTAVGNGTAVITVETEDGKYTATCQVTVIIGDFNDNDGVDIGDLAIAAYYYNTTSADDNWQQARIADMDNDGDVDIVDLAIIARYILN